MVAFSTGVDRLQQTIDSADSLLLPFPPKRREREEEGNEKGKWRVGKRREGTASDMKSYSAATAYWKLLFFDTYISETLLRIL